MIVAPFGDAAIEVSADDAAHARRIARALAAMPFAREAVVGFDRVVLHVDRVAEEQLDAVRSALADLPAEVEATPRVHDVRVVYDGPDLGEVAAASGLSPLEVARIHAGAEYVVEVIGFLPGFAYLGGVDARIARPRRPSPRPRVAAGSVALANTRTAIYPLPSPGGWNLLGRVVDFTPFDPTRMPPSVFAVGDRVRFTLEDVCVR